MVRGDLLQAIESGAIDAVASPAVAQAHRRVYARFLGFDAEAVLAGEPPGEPDPACLAAELAAQVSTRPPRFIPRPPAAYPRAEAPGETWVAAHADPGDTADADTLDEAHTHARAEAPTETLGEAPGAARAEAPGGPDVAAGDAAGVHLAEVHVEDEATLVRIWRASGGPAPEGQSDAPAVAPEPSPPPREAPSPPPPPREWWYRRSVMIAAVVAFCMALLLSIALALAAGYGQADAAGAPFLL